MARTDPPPRIPRLTREQRSPDVQSLIDLFSGPGRLDVDENHVLNTLGQHPALAQVFLEFNRYLLVSATLPVGLRQLAILRICWLKQARYMWASHLRTSLRNGLDEAVFEAVKTGSAASGWQTEERSILLATEQLVARSDLDDHLWAELSGFLNRHQLLEFLFTVGNYVQLALVLNAIRIEREPELVALAERYGEPR